MKIRLSNKLKNIILILITILIFIVLFTKVDLMETIKTLKKTNLSFFFLAIIISIISNIFICAHRWFLVLKELNGKISFKEVIFVKIGSYPLCTVMPFKSGELLKSVYLKKKKILSFKKSTSSLLYNALVDMFALVILFVIGITLLHLHIFNLIYPYIIFVVVLSFFYVLWKIEKTRKFLLGLLKKNDYKFRNIIHDIMISFEKISLKKTILLTIYATIFNFFSVLIYYIIFASINIKVPFNYILIFMPLVMLISQIPITVSGFGTREAAIVILFSKFADAEALLSVGLLVSFVNYMFPALIGLFFVRSFIKSL